MSQKTYDVVGIGNAIVDVLGRVEEDFLEANGVQKGVMQLIDAERAIEIYGKMGPATEISGGSAANTIAGLGMLGAKSAYVGKVKDDQLGQIFAHDIRALGVDYTVAFAPKSMEGDETGRCIVLVTPDGERSMNTYLGVSAALTEHDIDEALMADTKWIYLEGYRFDGLESQDAFRKAIAATKAAGGKVSITLSDPFCIERHRSLFRQMCVEEIDLLFANEHEIVSLYETGTLEEAMEMARKEVETVAVTVGPKGAHILQGETSVHVPAAPMERVDATGAGDLFAAGFLFGLTSGRDLETCGAMGCAAAGEVISHMGARPEEDLKGLFKRFGLI